MSDMYIASPDWLKLAWIVLPCATIYGVAWIWGRVRMKTTPTATLPETPWLEVQGGTLPPTGTPAPPRAIP